MRNRARELSPAVFASALFCFLLPFVAVSCEGRPVAIYTGVQLAKVEVSGNLETEFQEVPDAELLAGSELRARPWATLSFVLGAAGFLLSFFGSKFGAAVMALSGLASLVMIKVNLDQHFLREGLGMIQAEYDIGYWLTGLLYLCAFILNVL